MVRDGRINIRRVGGMDLNMIKIANDGLQRN